MTSKRAIPGSFTLSRALARVASRKASTDPGLTWTWTWTTSRLLGMGREYGRDSLMRGGLPGPGVESDALALPPPTVAHGRTTGIRRPALLCTGAHGETLLHRPRQSRCVPRPAPAMAQHPRRVAPPGLPRTVGALGVVRRPSAGARARTPWSVAGGGHALEALRLGVAH